MGCDKVRSLVGGEDAQTPCSASLSCVCRWLFGDCMCRRVSTDAMAKVCRGAAVAWANDKDGLAWSGLLELN